MTNKRKGFSLIELLIVVAIILILAAIAVPRMDKVQMTARESAATRMIHTLHTVQAQYHAQYGRYAASLAELGPPVSGTPGPSGADLISRDFAAGRKDGYIFTIQLAPAGYTINANPEAFLSTGRRTFYSDQTLVIRQNWSAEPATSQSQEF
jgi:prepilin-type N-terminal cleavage/methylation domain-containing protein